MKYSVADHLFEINASPEVLRPLANYAPFETSSEAAPLFAIRFRSPDSALPSTEGWESVYTDRSDDDMPRIELYRRPSEWLFRLSVTRDGGIVCAIQCDDRWQSAALYALPEYTRFAIDNAAMLLFAFAVADKRTLLFHSSVTVREGKGYLFLGHSGTGKSTHSRQWLAAFPDAALLNDDNPAVRVLPSGEVRVYGTPWSGKTPCYKNEQAPVQALVQLAQAPHNEIRKLKMTQAYPYILASVSGLKVLPEMMDDLYESIAALLAVSPVYYLECLPNTAAARLCAQTCSL